MALEDGDYDSAMAGGPTGYYNPAFGLLAIQNPEQFVQHLAARGIQPPADFPDNFNHQDAHKALGSSLKDQSRYENPNSPLANFNERFGAAFQTQPPGDISGQSPGPVPLPEDAPFSGTGAVPPRVPLPHTRPAGAPKLAPPDDHFAGPEPGSFEDRFAPTHWGRQDQGLPPSVMAYSDPNKVIPDADERPWEGKPGSTPPPAPSKPPVTFKSMPLETKPLGAALKDPGAGGDSSAPWGGKPFKDADALPDKPTPTADVPSTAGGSAPPAHGKETLTGGLDTKDPNPTKKETSKKDDSIDSFGKALAGLSAMKPPTPIFPHPGNIPHPSNQISRSTVPTELLKELSSIGHPGNQIRLGALLKGR